MESWKRRWWRRLTLPLAGYVLAALSHMAWNSLGVIISGVAATAIGMPTLPPDIFATIQGNLTLAPVWMNWLSSVAAVIVSNFISYLVIIIGLRRSERWERAVMADHLRDEVGTSTVTADEFSLIETKCEPPRQDPIAREIFTAQCNLAKRKFRLILHNRGVDTDPVVLAWREDLQKLRQLTSA